MTKIVSRETKELSKLVKSQLDVLNQGVHLLGFFFTYIQISKFELYLEQLYLWNLKTNLFSRNDTNRLVERHILESIAWIPRLKDKLLSPMMDLGSGAGFPGIPISILYPNLDIALVESKKKKAKFLSEMAHNLELNITVYPERVENLILQEYHQGRYHLIMARAVASLTKLFQWTNELLKKDGKLITFKGDKLEEEINALKTNYSQTVDFTTKVVVYETPINLYKTAHLQNRRFVIVQKS